MDKAGRTVDFFLSRNRDVNAAKAFRRSAMKRTCKSRRVLLSL
jgi:transposase-like protein